MLNRTLEHLVKRMQRTDLVRVPGSEMSILARAPDSFCKRNCALRVSIAAVTALRTSFSSLPTTGFSSLRERFHLLAPRGNAAAASEIFHSRGLERLLVSRGFDFAQRFVAELFEWMGHSRKVKLLRRLHRYNGKRRPREGRARHLTSNEF